MRRTVAAVLCMASCGWAADPAAGTRLNFVACPIVRDTKTVPCYLAEYQGATYYLGIQQDIGAEFYPPQLLHDVLVEGVVAEGPKTCGGIPLKPLSISVLPELNKACNVILPAEQGLEAPPARRPAGPSTRGAGPIAAPVPVAPLQPPFAERQFQIGFTFDSDYIDAHTSRVVNDAVAYAKASGGHVEIKGSRAAVALSNGQTMVEMASMAGRRASKVAQIFAGRGIQAALLSVAADEVVAQDRRVVIVIRPGR